MLEFLKGKQPKAKLSALEDKAKSAHAEKRKRDEHGNTLRTRRDAIRLDVATGDSDAKDELSAINAELAELAGVDDLAAGALGDLGVLVAEAKRAIAAEEEAAERAARIKGAKADLKRLPTIFDEMKRLDARHWALQQELASMGTLAKPSGNLDTWQSEATAWLEWRAGMRERDPVSQQQRDEYAELQEARAHREADDRFRRSHAGQEAADSRFRAAGYTVPYRDDKQWNSELREWV